MDKYKDYKLCYMDTIDDYAVFHLYFTSKYEGQWGDDWNDRPADCNAGTPYNEDRDIIDIIIILRGYASPVYGARYYSAEDMNTGRASWLIYDSLDFAGGDTFDVIINTIKDYNKRVENYNSIVVYTKYLGDDK